MEKDMIIAHVLPDTGPHLNQTISKLILRTFPNSPIYLREEYGMFNTSKALSENLAWINDLPQNVYAGQLEARRMFSKAKGYLSSILGLILPEFSISSMIRLINGPKYWVIHGRPLKFGTILFMRILGKRISVIHWGGRAEELPARKTKILYKLAYTMLNRYYVLMTPEVKGFAKNIGSDLVAVLPYPMILLSNNCTEYHSSVVTTQKTLILGNNGYSRDDYGEILDKLNPGEWDKIICMMNYGKELDIRENEAFISKYEKKFGGAFFAWQETLPFVQYVEYVKKPMCYIGPQETQSGLGAIFLSVLAGRAIFLRGDNYAWLKEIGVDVCHIDDVDDWSYENVLKHVPSLEIYQKNCDAVIKHHLHISNENYWKKVLTADLIKNV